MMLKRIIQLSIQNRVVILVAAAFLSLLGLYSAQQLAIDAVPDITDNQVQIITRTPSLGAPDVERLITFPVEQANANIPGLKEKILFRQVLSPWDIEQTMGLTEGNIFHGELSLEQLLFQRPMADFSKYKTSISKLWMCGSGTHPGGGIMGASGELCAKTMLTSRAI